MIGQKSNAPKICILIKKLKFKFKMQQLDIKKIREKSARKKNSNFLYSKLLKMNNILYIHAYKYILLLLYLYIFLQDIRENE
jgi:hypothetical protein